MLSEFEKKVIAAIQGDIPVTARPYRDIAGLIGVPEDKLIAALRDLCRRGIIRRFGATLRHQKSGLTANAMVAWQVDEAVVDRAGETLAGFAAVSHCYRRNPAPGWPYNLYTMVHARNEQECLGITRQMAALAGIETYKVLFSQKELKKTSMQYFDDEND
ncbi:MAG: Lrp/AsnC family transcriptional regulator [Thermodesulfobacteriota bacterium]